MKVTEIEGEWAKVTYKKQTGYVKTEFLLLSSALAGKTVYPDGGEAVAYTAPDAGTRILTVYGGGTPLAVTAVADGWAAVDCAGQTGYVPVSALSMQRETPGEETGFLPEAAVTVLDCTLTLTETEAETLPAGTEVTVCGLLADGLCRAETPLGWGALPRDALCLSPYPDEAVRLEGLPPTEAAALAETALKKAYQDFGKQRLYSVITLEGDSAYQCGFFSDADQHLYSAAVRADGRVTAVCAYTGFAAPQLDGKCFLVTGTGKYFKNVQYAPEVNLGIVRLTKGGETAELLWGFADGGQFTSEFPAHMMSHVARLAVDPDNRVVMHCHPANLLAMTYVHSLDEREFTRTLWQMCTECIVVFPDGVNVLPWMLCGTNAIGEATAEKMKTARLVVWSQHGIYGAGRDLDETFGLIETAEKAAEIYMKIAHLPRLNTITDEQLHLLEGRFGVKGREGYLD